MSQFKLGKPPIVESSIGYDFEPNAEKVSWDGKLANELADSLGGEFPKKEFRYRSEVQIVQGSPGQVPIPTSFEHRLEEVRIQNESATRILQITDDRIFYHQLKDQQSWPGFEPLLERSLDIVDLYMASFRPARIKMAILHDVDIVKIPLAGKAIELDEYFKLVRELPQEPFGLIQGYATGYVTVSPHDGEPLQISLQLLPTSPDAQECVFSH